MGLDLIDGVNLSAVRNKVLGMQRLQRQKRLSSEWELLMQISLTM